jgi:hypothetical protein
VARRAGASLGLLLTLLVGGVLIVLWKLDANPVRSRLRAALHDRLGLEFDYEEASVTLGGAHLRAIRLPTPAADRADAPELLRVGQIDLQWSVLPALVGSSAKIHDALIRDVEITLVVDEQGETSLDRFLHGLKLGPPPAKPAPKSPLSHALESLGLPVIERLRLEDVHLALVRRENGRVVERVRLDGLRAEGRVEPGSRVRLAVGAPDNPLDAVLALESLRPAAPGKRELAARLSWTVDVQPPGEVRTALDLRLVRQSFTRLPPLERVVQLDAAVRFAPAEQRTHVELTRLALVDDAVTGSASLELADGPAGAVLPRVRTATGTIDLTHLARAVPPELGELVLSGGKIAYTLKELELAPALRFAASGELRLDGAIAELDAKAASGGKRVRLDGLRLEARGRPDGGDALAVELKLPIERLELSAPGASLRLRDLTLGARAARLQLGSDGAHGEVALELGIDDADAHAGSAALTLSRAGVTVDGALPGGTRPLVGNVGLRLDRLTVRQAGAQAELGGADLKLALRDLALQPMAATGNVTLTGRIARLASHRAGAAVAASDVGIDAAARLADAAPAELRLKLPIGRLGVRRDDGRALLAPTAGRVELSLDRVALDAAAPARSRAQARLAIDLGAIAINATVDKATDRAAYHFEAKAPSLALLRPLVGGAAPWERMSLRLESNGTVAGLDGRAPTLEEKTTLALQHGALRGTGLDVATDALEAQLSSKGGARQHAVDLALHLAGLRLDGNPVGTDRLTLHGNVDLDRPRVELSLKGEGSPQGHLALQAEFDARTRTLRYHADADLSRMGLVGVLLPASLRAHNQVDWPRVAVTLRSEGTLRDVVRAVAADGTPTISPKLVETARGTQTTELELHELHWRGDGERTVDLGGLHVRTRIEATDAHRTAEAEVTIPELHGTIAGVRLDISELHSLDTLSLDGEFLTDPTELRLAAEAKELRQSAYPFYPIGGLTLRARIHGDGKGGVLVEEARLDNRRGGTTLDLGGGVDLYGKAEVDDAKDDSWVPGRRGVSLSGTLTQRLDALDTAPAELQGRGTFSLPFRVDSGDLSLFRTSATARFDDVSLTLPRKQLALAHLRGRVPLVQDIVLDAKQGVIRLGGADVGAYPRLRFTDQHPFLTRNDFLSLDELRVGARRYGPAAGNARLDRNVLALDQLEMQALGGKISGQCLIDWRGASSDTEVQFRGTLTGVRPSTGGTSDDERLDANAALVFAPAHMQLEGRAEIVRIGRRHLLDVLDAYDPYRADVNANRARLALKIGYPKQVRLRFHEGFASLGLELGGAARVVRIDEVRGVPVGPLLDRYLGPIFRRED